jgi:hypothetical protein
MYKANNNNMESKTIFDLPTSIDQLPGINDPMSRMQYDQVSVTRDITGANFPNGQQHMRFEISGTKRWIPNKSYIRMSCRLAKTLTAEGALTTALVEADQVAPNMGLMSNLFQSGEFRISDKTVSRTSDYMAQIDALQTRMDKSKSWVDSQGKASNFWNSDIKERIADVSSDGKSVVKKFDMTTRLELGFVGATQLAIAVTGIITVSVGTLVDFTTIFVAGDEIEIDAGGAVGTLRYRISNVINATTMQLNNIAPTALADAAYEFRRYRPTASRAVNEFELIWQPPMSIFKVQEALPAGKYELVLNPQTSSAFKLRAVETLAAVNAKVAGTDYNFHVIDMYLYIATVESERIDDLTYYINLDETRCQIDTGAGSSVSLTQKNFDVSPSTYALTCAFQDEAAGSNPLYSASKLKVRSDGEQSLTRLFVSYGGQSKPQPDASPEFKSGVDRTVQRYSDSLLQSGQYFREGGSESLSEWQERGSYYHFAWPRDGRDRSTRAQVNFAMSAPANTRVLLFDHYKSVAHVSVKSGRVVDVQLLEG